eukprot:816005-Pyramimonas_sp.AAC.1
MCSSSPQGRASIGAPRVDLARHGGARLSTRQFHSSALTAWPWRRNCCCRIESGTKSLALLTRP